MFYFQISSNDGQILSDMMTASSVSVFFLQGSENTMKLEVVVEMRTKKYDELIDDLDLHNRFNLFFFDYNANSSFVFDNAYLNSYRFDYDSDKNVFLASFFWIYIPEFKKNKVNWKMGL